MTKETNETRAENAAALKLAAAIKGGDPLDRKPPKLREYSWDFLEWVATGRLESDTRRYYRNGWRLLQQTKIAGMRVELITKDEVEKLEFPGSCATLGCATPANSTACEWRTMAESSMRRQCTALS